MKKLSWRNTFFDAEAAEFKTFAAPRLINYLLLIFSSLLLITCKHHDVVILVCNYWFGGLA